MLPETLPETPRPLRQRKMASPVGELTLLAGDDGLAAVLWQDERPGRVVAGPAEPGGHPMLDAAQDQLNAYFEGRLRRFDLPLDFAERISSARSGGPC